MTFNQTLPINIGSGWNGSSLIWQNLKHNIWLCLSIHIRLSHLFFKLYFRFFGPKSLPSKNISYFLQIFAIIWKCPKIWNYLSKAENSCIYFECHIFCVIEKFYQLCDISHRSHFCMTNANYHSKFLF